MVNVGRTLFIIVLTLQTNTALAQWSKEDSVWLQNVLSGKVKLELTPEAQKAIEEGTLIITGQPANPNLSAPSVLPIERSFSNIKPEDEDAPIDFSKIPPSVFMQLNIDTTTVWESLVFTEYRAIPLEINVPLGGGRYSIVSGTDVSYQIVKDGIRSDMVSTGVGMSFSAEDILRYLFWPSERAKKRNRKHANAWRGYYGIP
jgi:hypothetical protein